MSHAHTRSLKANRVTHPIYALTHPCASKTSVICEAGEENIPMRANSNLHTRVWSKEGRYLEHECVQAMCQAAVRCPCSQKPVSCTERIAM